MDESISVSHSFYDHYGLVKGWGYYMLSDYQATVLPSNAGPPDCGKYVSGCFGDFMRLSTCSVNATKMDHCGYISSIQVLRNRDSCLWDDTMYSHLQAAISQEAKDSRARDNDLQELDHSNQSQIFGSRVVIR